MNLEHHRDLAHEFPELKARIHELKPSSPAFRRLYKEYQALDDEIHRIEQDIETTSDAYAEQLKFKRVLYHELRPLAGDLIQEHRLSVQPQIGSTARHYC